MKRITDPSFRYVSAAATDIRKTFDRIRRNQETNRRRDAANEQERATKVEPLRKVKA